jgi:hypothetical protein
MIKEIRANKYYSQSVSLFYKITKEEKERA